LGSIASTRCASVSEDFFGHSLLLVSVDAAAAFQVTPPWLGFVSVRQGGVTPTNGLPTGRTRAQPQREKRGAVFRPAGGRFNYFKGTSTMAKRSLAERFCMTSHTRICGLPRKTPARCAACGERATQLLRSPDALAVLACDRHGEGNQMTAPEALEALPLDGAKARRARRRGSVNTNGQKGG
jgi:hypothetical protein